MNNRGSIEVSYTAAVTPFWVTHRLSSQADLCVLSTSCTQKPHFFTCNRAAMPPSLMGRSQKLNEVPYLAHNSIFQTGLAATAVSFTVYLTYRASYPT